MLVAHAVHLDDAEVDVAAADRTAIAAYPWAYLRLGQGVTGAGRHARAVDAAGASPSAATAENAGDLIDPLRAAALLAGLAKDSASTRRASARTMRSRCSPSAAPKRSGWRTRSARSRSASGPTSSSTIAGRTGSRRGADPVLQLVWGSDGRSVRDVVIDGRVVVRDRRCTTVDVDALRDGPRGPCRHLLAEPRRDVARPRWPLV